MNDHKEKSLSWHVADGVIELKLHRPPANEIGLAMLDDLELFTAALPELESRASALILYSDQKAGFSAGADLRELYTLAQGMEIISAVEAYVNFWSAYMRYSTGSIPRRLRPSPPFTASASAADSNWH